MDHWLLEGILLDLTKTIGFSIETENFAGFGVKSEAESLSGFGFGFGPHPQFKHPNPESLKKCVKT